MLLIRYLYSNTYFFQLSLCFSLPGSITVSIFMWFACRIDFWECWSSYILYKNNIIFLDRLLYLLLSIFLHLDVSSHDNPWPRTNGRISFVEALILFSVPSHNFHLRKWIYYLQNWSSCLRKMHQFKRLSFSSVSNQMFAAKCDIDWQHQVSFQNINETSTIIYTIFCFNFQMPFSYSNAVIMFRILLWFLETNCYWEPRQRLEMQT